MPGRGLGPRGPSTWLSERKRRRKNEDNDTRQRWPTREESCRCPPQPLPQASVPVTVQDRPRMLAWRQGYSDSTKLPSKTPQGWVTHSGHGSRSPGLRLAHANPSREQPASDRCTRRPHTPPTLRTPSSLCPASLSVPVFQQLLFEPLCHILGILTIFQTFLLLHLLRSLVTTDRTH